MAERAHLILNPGAGSFTESVAENARARGWEVHETEGAEQTEHLARWAGSLTPWLFAAGGDGTIHHVLRGLYQASPRRAALGVVPLGTGNDLARSLGMPLDPLEALEALFDGPERTIDLGEVSVDGAPPRPFINALHLGVAHRVGEAADADAKRRWGPLAYVGAALEVRADLAAMGDLQLRVDDDLATSEPGVMSLVVANGRSVGGGMSVAPTADLEDGLLDLTLVRDASLVELAPLAVLARQGRTLESSHVTHHLARSLSVRLPDGMAATLDGEVLEGTVFDVRVLPRALRVVVGPGYHREQSPRALRPSAAG